MALIKNRVLQALNRIYNPVGSAAPAEIETDVPVQVVHDVSRQAEFGAGLGAWNGLFFNQIDLTHAGADTQRGILDPYARVRAGGIITPGGAAPPNIDFWCWHLYTMAWATAGNVSAFAVGIVIDNGKLAYSPNDVLIPVFYADSVYSYTNLAGSGDLTAITEKGNERSDQTHMQPILIPDGGLHTFRSVSTGAMVVHAQVACWAGFKGTFPPGYG